VVASSEDLKAYRAFEIANLRGEHTKDPNYRPIMVGIIWPSTLLGPAVGIGSPHPGRSSRSGR
jgi:hypothetical protein